MCVMALGSKFPEIIGEEERKAHGIWLSSGMCTYTGMPSGCPRLNVSDGTLLRRDAKGNWQPSSVEGK